MSRSTVCKYCYKAKPCTCRVRRDNYTQTWGISRAAWNKVRLNHLADNPLCFICEKNGRTTAAFLVHHIIDHKGNLKLFFDTTNHQSLCKSCHDKVRSEGVGVNI